ncbi:MULTISPECIES: BMP family lipoprotein [Halorussus]|uniref:BMP family lipoprotein n=1 Tax=Halorussus TaxID=1070314 RepID=UPI00209EE2C7|nr:BMP family ABC transporter substrate-binding protein [Halorussus vallis]USZ78207.1 BMP family ABC transporter substrate-binding protein [Halorussus vallis]
MTRHTDETDGAEPAYAQKLTAGGVNRRRVLRSGVALVGGIGLAGCTGSQDGGTTTDTTTSGGGGGGGGGEPTNVAIVSSPAGFGDKAFNDLALEGLQNAAKKFNIKIQQVEETDQSQYGTVQSRLAESRNPDYDLIVLVGYNHTQALESNASQYSDQKWMLINDYVDQPNVAGYTWANHQMSFQAGVLAGTMTTRQFSHAGNSTTADNPTVGFVGGVDGALINAFERSYRAGAKWVNQDVSVKVGYIGNYTDTQTANNIASSQYDAGADIVYHAASAAGQGVFQAAQNANRFAIGVDADQSKTLPNYEDVIMGSAVKYINEGTNRVASAVAQGNWQQVNGENVLGLEQDAVAVVLGRVIGPKLPDLVNKNLEESRKAIVNGDVTVPCSASGCQN